MRIPVMILGLLPMLLLATAFSIPQDGDQAVLIWRTLAGATRQSPLDQAPGAELEEWMGPWMEPQGLPAASPLESPDPMRVGLVGGDRLFGVATGGDGGALEVQCIGATRLNLSIDWIASLVFPGRQAGRGSLQPASEGDRLYRLAGKGLDRIDGVLVGFDPKGVRFEGSLGEKLYPWDEVVGLFIEALSAGPEGSNGSDKAKPLALVEWTDGSRLRGSLVSVESGGVTLAPISEFEAPSWFIPISAVREMVLLDGSFRFLSWQTMEAMGPDRSPFDPPGAEPLGMVWPHRIDRSVTGGPLLAGGRSWTQGLGVHAPSHLKWKLDGADCQLVFSAALDDSALPDAKAGRAQGGSVEFQVLVDGKSAWKSGRVTSGQAVLQPDPIDLKGAATLELLVTDGGDGPVRDRANWLRPLLIGCDGGEGN